MAAPSLSIVIPLYREEDNVVPLLARVHEALADYRGPWELICVDDGSTDRTAERLKSEAKRYGAHVRIALCRRNFGQTAAMQAGIDASRGDVVVTLDGDLQNDPHDIPRMVDAMEERGLDLLAGRRANRQDRLFSRRIPSKIANWLIGKVTDVTIRDYGCSLKAYRGSVIRRVRLYGEMHRLIPLWVAMVTSPSRIGEIDVGHNARTAGESKYGISRTFRVILDLLTAFFFLRYHARPGHFFGSIGLAFGAIGSAMAAYLTFVKFGLGQNVGGRPLLLVTILMLVFSIQFLTTGVLAEILSRIFHSVGGARTYSLSEIAPPETAGWRLPAATRTAGISHG